MLIVTGDQLPSLHVLLFIACQLINLLRKVFSPLCLFSLSLVFYSNEEETKKLNHLSLSLLSHSRDQAFNWFYFFRAQSIVTFFSSPSHLKHIVHSRERHWEKEKKILFLYSNRLLMVSVLLDHSSCLLQEMQLSCGHLFTVKIILLGASSDSQLQSHTHPLTKATWVSRRERERKKYFLPITSEGSVVIVGRLKRVKVTQWNHLQVKLLRVHFLILLTCTWCVYFLFFLSTSSITVKAIQSSFFLSLSTLLSLFFPPVFISLFRFLSCSTCVNEREERGGGGEERRGTHIIIKCIHVQLADGTFRNG